MANKLLRADPMDTFSTMLADYDSRANKARGMGGTAKLEARRATGILNARERLECLLDGDSFTESGLFAVSHRPEMRDKSPADGKIGGFGTVSGRPVAIVSNDFTVLGASSSQVNGRKIQHIKQVATRAGMPLIFLGESAGARMPDRMGAAGRAMLGQDPEEYQRIRKTPWVSAVLGPCFGSSTWYSCMSDFVVMRKGGLLAVASSRVTSVAINQKIDPEELGGWKMHATTTGLVDRVVDTDEEALAAIRTFLGYLPSHSGEAPPKGDCGAPAGAEGRTILDILPESRHRTYDMRKLVAVIADADSVFPLKERFGRSIVTALARLGGRSVGIIANNPMFKGGAIDVDACRKATSFMVLCDSFNLPLVFLTDQPGFLIGVEGEVRGAPGLIMNWMNALSLVTVPKIAIVLRKSYGQAYLNMGGGRNSDEMALWPTADLGFMDPAVAVNILHGLERADDPQRFDTLAAEIARDSSAWELAAGYQAQSVIHPAETRDYIRQVLDIHEDRMSGGVGKHRLANWPTSY
jgi:acetyl-CoA carboxylase carboxyltransferase component